MRAADTGRKLARTGSLARAQDHHERREPVHHRNADGRERAEKTISGGENDRTFWDQLIRENPASRGTETSAFRDESSEQSSHSSNPNRTRITSPQT